MTFFALAKQVMINGYTCHQSMVEMKAVKTNSFETLFTFNILKAILTLQIHFYYTNKEVFIITGWFLKSSQSKL
jgi:hypothetical protein